VTHLKMRAAILGIVALFIMSGTMTSIASASPFFHVAGVKLAEGTVKQVKLQLKGKAVLVSTKLGVEVECLNSVSEGATLENTTTQGQGKGRVSYSSCKVLKPGQPCAVAEPITTKPLKSFLADETGTGSKNFTEVFEPTENTTFVELKFSGSGCGLLIGSQPVKGSADAEVVPKEVNGQEGLLSFPGPEKVKHLGTEVTVALTVATDPSTFTAAYGVRLAEFPTTFGVFLN
jgi:hypothetical protein